MNFRCRALVSFLKMYSNKTPNNHQGLYVIEAYEIHKDKFNSLQGNKI
jgi:hypothetical protein